MARQGSSWGQVWPCPDSHRLAQDAGSISERGPTGPRYCLARGIPVCSPSCSFSTMINGFGCRDRAQESRVDSN